MWGFLSSLTYCAWCSVKMTWWRPWVLRNFCTDCSVIWYPLGESDPRHHGFHERIGMKER